MKKFYFVLFALLTVVAGDTFAVELIHRDNTGTRHYECTKKGVIGKAQVKKVSQDSFRVLGKVFSGIVKADSPFFAAEIGCGEVAQKND